MGRVNDNQKNHKTTRTRRTDNDTNILYADKHLRSLESVTNAELAKVYEWLTANRLTLNIKKSKYVIFHPYQKALTFQPKINMYDNKKQSQSSRLDWLCYLRISPLSQICNFKTFELLIN